MTEMEAKEIVASLENEGYFKWTPVDRVAQQKEKMIKSLSKDNFAFDYERYEEESILGSVDRRCYGADAEDLAEGGVGGFLKDLNDLAQRIGLKIDDAQIETCDGQTYIMTINGEYVTLYTPEDASDSWRVAPKRIMEFLNTKLEQLGTSERFYGVNGGNDQQIVLLTPALVTLLSKYMKEKPYKPENM